MLRKYFQLSYLIKAFRSFSFLIILKLYYKLQLTLGN